MRASLRHCVVFLLLVLPMNSARPEDVPRSPDPRLKVELFAEQPHIVTPTGIDVDYRGRVFAIESNTHFPPADYKGHPTDRVLVLSDADSDGRADEITVFSDGLKFTMSVMVKPVWLSASSRSDKADSAAAAAIPEQSVYVATRSEIFLFHDDNGDDRADRRESIVRLETKGDYPHNGLAGFAIDALGWLYFGFGENLGEGYTIFGADGTSLSGGGEGGNVYRCRLDGSHLNLVATGFWNPHASCVDAFGRLFTVDNDPDSRPPCRLLHVIPGGDYGYRFRNGRKGLHPFTAWNGEIPGTLPMVAGTGEAPSGILAYEADGLPEEYTGNLLVTSWGDHRIDRFRLQPQGASFASLAEPLIIGGEDFRPVGLAVAPDGSLYCTDWVQRDYKLHSRGRIWRIAPIESSVRHLQDLSAVAGFSAEDATASFFCAKRLDVRRAAARRLFELDQLPGQIPDEEMCRRLLPRSRLEAAWLEWPEASGEMRRLPEQRPAAAVERWTQLVPLLRASHDSAEPAPQQLLPGLLLAGASAAAQSVERDDEHPNQQFSLLAQLSEYDFLKDRAAIPIVLSAHDPFVFSVVVNALAVQFSRDDFARYLIPDAVPDVKAAGPLTRQAILLAARKQNPKDDGLAVIGLADNDPDVRRLAVQWVAEERFTKLSSQVEAVFRSPTVTPELFLATLACLEMLSGKAPVEFDSTPAANYLLPLVQDDQRPSAVRAQALRLVSPVDESLNAALLGSLISSDDEFLRNEAMRTLQAARPEVSGELLRKLAGDENVGTAFRAEAVMGLSEAARLEPVGGPSRKLLRSFLDETAPIALRVEALRAVRPLIVGDAEIRGAVERIAESIPLLDDGEIAHRLADEVGLALSSAQLKVPAATAAISEPKPQDREGWMARLNRGRDADPVAGRRVFFHPNGPGCYKCHTVEGRGGHVGPDLSRSIGTMNRIQLIQSILEPSREIAPQFISWTFETNEGKIVTGMIVHENGGKTIVGNAEGQLTELKTADIASRVPQKISVMPEKLADRMTLQELRDLIAFLDTEK